MAQQSTQTSLSALIKQLKTTLIVVPALVQLTSGTFVESDMYMGLSDFYKSTYIDEAFEKLADEFELDIAWDRLQVLKTDFLGMEA